MKFQSDSTDGAWPYALGQRVYWRAGSGNLVGGTIEARLLATVDGMLQAAYDVRPDGEGVPGVPLFPIRMFGPFITLPETL